MALFEGIILNLTCLLFPLSIYIISLAYSRNLNEQKDKLFLQAALFSSTYLLIRFGSKTCLIYPMILLNIPLLVAYLKGENNIAICLSILFIVYYYFNTNINISYLIIEYIIYFISYNYLALKKTKSALSIIRNFVIIKSFIMSLEMSLIFPKDNHTIINFVLIFSIMILFTMIAYLILYLLNKGEEIMDLNNIVHELEKEKKLRESLFKITHEIKNPIAVCKGYLDMMDDYNIDKIKNYIPIIKDEINRTLILMDDFLDYTRIQIDKEITDVNLLIEDTCNVIKPLFKKNHIKLNLNLKEEDEIYANLDYNRIKQVIVNILKNSIEAKDKKKNNHYVDIKVGKNKKEICITIKDNGIGMDRKTLLNSKEMFYTTKAKGTGLGVPLSKEIIKKHDGIIKYSSVKNKYTLVTIILPYEDVFA